VRITTVLARILALKQIRICAVHLEAEGLTLDVAPTTRVPICSGCFKRVHAVHDTYEGRQWRHLDVAGMQPVAALRDPSGALSSLRRDRGAGAVGGAAVLVHV